MYPNLSYLVHALTGWGPDNALSVVQTFGLFLALAFVAAGFVFQKELRRKAQEGLLHATTATIQVGAPPSWLDIAWNGLFGFVIGFKGIYAWQHADAFQADPSGVILSSQGHALGGLIGLLIFGGWKWWQRYRSTGTGEAKKVKIYPHDRVWDMAMIAGISGVAGAKLFSILEDPAALVNDPLSQIFSGAGLNIFGGLILGFAAVYTYIRLKKIPAFHVMDAVAPGLITGYGVGRMGCQFSGDGDWGIPNPHPQPDWWFLPDGLWASRYPHNVIQEGVPIPDCTWDYCMQLAEPVYPTPLYEILMSAAILGILWSIRKRIRIPGVLFFVYVLLIAVERFWIEKIRVNDKYDVLGWQATQAEAIAVVLFVIGLAGIGILIARHRRQASAE